MPTPVLDPVAEFIELTVSGLYDASATAIDIDSGDEHYAVTLDPAVSGQYNLLCYDATVYAGRPQDDPNKEWFRVTAKSGTAPRLTVIRGQEGTAASTKSTVGSTYKLIQGYGKKFRNDLEEAMIDVGIKYSWITCHGGVGDGVADDKAAFDAAIAAGVTHLVVPSGTWNIGSNLTLPKALTLKPLRGAILTPTTGVTLTVNCHLDADPSQHFGGAGTVVFGAEQTTLQQTYPQWWGAKGDGTTNDSAAIQAAIDAVSPYGGIVFLPAATYKVSSSLTMLSRVILQGAGDSATLIYSTADITIVRMGSGSASCWNASIRDLQIKGNNTGTSQIGLLLNGTSSTYSVAYCDFRNVVITHCGGCHLKATYSWIDKFDNVRIGMAASPGKNLDISDTCNLLTFTDCSWNYSTYDGWAMTVDGTGHVFISPQVQDNAATLGTWLFGTSGKYAKGCKVIGNAWLENNHNGSLIKVAGTSESMVRLSGLTIGNPTGTPPAYDVELLSGYENVVEYSIFENDVGTALITLGASQVSPIIIGNKSVNTTSTLIENPTNGNGCLLWAFNGATYALPMFMGQIQANHTSIRVNRAAQDGAYDALVDGDTYSRWAVDTYGQESRGPGNAPADTILLRDSENYLRLAAGDSFGANILEVNTALAAAPSTLREGMFVRADRVNWDPLAKGSGGSYFVWYNGSAWVAMDSQ